MAQKIHQTPFPTWDATDPGASLQTVKDWAVEKASANVAWYRKQRQPKKKGSIAIRAAAIILGALGALCPLIDATLQNVDPARFQVDLGEFGYVLIAAAAGVFAYDRYFGLSSGWIRYMLSELTIDKLLTGLEYDWALLVSAMDPKDSDQCKAALSRLKEFSLRVDEVVREETDAWATEFRSNLTELEKTLKREAEARKPGSIKLSVPNAGEFQKVSISIDGKQVTQLTAGTEELLRGLSPGGHRLVVEGTRGSETSAASKVVVVEAGSMAQETLAIPKKQP